MTLFWFDDALAEARDLAVTTGVRHKVTRTRVPVLWRVEGGRQMLSYGWTVDLANNAVLEACS